MFTVLFASAQETEKIQKDRTSQKQFKNTGISLYMGFSCITNNQFKHSLQNNGIMVDVPKVNGLMGIKINAIDIYGHGIISVEAGMEGNYRKENNHYIGLRTVYGTVEYLYPAINRKKIRLLPSLGVEYSYAIFKYNSLDNSTISFQDLSIVKDGSINLHQNYSFSALLGTYFNYFITNNNGGLSFYIKCRIPFDKKNARWKVENTDRTVTDLDKYISNYLFLGVGYVFTF
jgi:hypothetical protein